MPALPPLGVASYVVHSLLRADHAAIVMQDYTQQFREALAEFESPIVHAGEEDAAKGQVTVLAGFRIHQIYDPNVGYIRKHAGQTQFAGVSVDALLDQSDGSGADFLTDVDVGNNLREIRVVFTRYPPAKLGTRLPPDNWVQPTLEHVNTPGPLVRRLELPGEIEQPGEVPPAEGDRLDRIEAAIANLEQQIREAADRAIATDNANTEKIQQQLHAIVEDAERSLFGMFRTRSKGASDD